MSSVTELKKDLEELIALSAQATRPKIKDIFTISKHRLETDIINLEIKEKVNAEKSPNKISNSSVGTAASNKRYVVELNGYAWDQSDKFVKLFVTLEGVNKLDVSNVTTVFTENSVQLTVQNLNNKDYMLVIKNLHSKINVEKSYNKIKTDMVAIYMEKCVPGENWSHLTLTEKRVKDSAMKKENNSDIKDDPTAGIMNLMKQMYQSGDSETKKMIAKAWTESQSQYKDRNDFQPPRF